MSRVGGKVVTVGFYVIFILVILVTILLNTAYWLVADSEPQKADIVIVMGGGGASRLRMALSLYDKKMASELLLVDLKANCWEQIIRHLCTDCILADKKVTILSGSKSTMTDAELSLKYCQEKGLEKILVVTDPYHTRRTALTFSRVFRESNIEVHLVSSDDYGRLLSPDDSWWRDNKTLDTVLRELGKCIVVLMPW